MSQIIKCKNCGAELNLSLAKDGVVECEYCFSLATIPKETNSGAEQFLHIGEHDLDTGKFHEAFEAYKKAAELDESEPEAYWGMALSEFKVQYLKDGVNNRLQPICHGIKNEEFQDNPNFLKALRYATTSQRAVYEKRAKEIDYIRNEFYKLERSGLDYDCFLCVKVTDDVTKERTADYKVADDIYFALRGKGYKPFFSERELGNVTGADYEARILYALMKSECMLVVCSNEEYLNTKWVKNEYTRFLRLMNDEEKESDAITVVFNGRPIEHLPGKNGKIQGIDLRNLNAMENIVSFVDSHTPEARRKKEQAEEAERLLKEEEERKRREENEEMRRRQSEIEERLKNMSAAPAGDSSGGSSVSAYIKRARMEQQDGSFGKAKEFYEKAIEIEPENGEAWWGLFLATCGAKNMQELLKKNRSVSELDEMIASTSLARAKRFAAGNCAEEIKEFEEKFIKVRQLALQREEEIRRNREAEKRREEEEEAKRAYVKANFEISGNKLVKYRGKGGAVIIPDSVTSIGSSAFEDCNKLTSATIPNSVTSIGDEAFAGCESLTSITIPNSVTSIGDEAFSYCNSLTSITIPNSVTSIGDEAFAGCNSLTSITIPNSVTSIGDDAFYKCSSLTSIIIPNSVTSIGNYAFLGCSSLTSITIPSSVTSIGDRAFYECSSLTSITIPSSVTSIGDEAFAGCSSLTSITIPNSVTSIGESAFFCCKSLKSVTFTGSKKEWKKIKIKKKGNKSLLKAEKIFLKN